MEDPTAQVALPEMERGQENAERAGSHSGFGLDPSAVEHEDGRASTRAVPPLPGGKPEPLPDEPMTLDDDPELASAFASPTPAGTSSEPEEDEALDTLASEPTGPNHAAPFQEESSERLILDPSELELLEDEDPTPTPRTTVPPPPPRDATSRGRPSTAPAQRRTTVPPPPDRDTDPGERARHESDTFPGGREPHPRDQTAPDDTD
jgi:hypothetical protein